MDNNINLLTVRRAPADRSATKTGFQRLPRLPQLLASKVSQREHLLGKIIAAQKHMFKTGALSRPRMERGRRLGREEGKGWRRKGRRAEGKGKGKEEGEGGEKGRRGWGGLGEVTGNGKEGRTEEGEKEEMGREMGREEWEKGSGIAGEVVSQKGKIPHQRKNIQAHRHKTRPLPAPARASSDH